LYNDFFNFTEQPFSLTPDPRFVYLSSGHQDALEHMRYGVDQRKGFILISGHVGAGKTTLTRLMIDQLEGQCHLALIFNTFLNEIELLRAINREFGLPAESASREQLIRTLNDFLIQLLHNGANAVLIIDEAQNLTVPVLEQIRMLSNLETDNQKLIQIVLVGQPELEKTLARPDLAQLNDRVTVRFRLGSLNQADTTRYIHHRLTVAGRQGSARFDPKTYNQIWKLSDGVPRRINALCDRALLVAYAKGSHRITVNHVRQAHRELTGPPQEKPNWRRSFALPLALILMVLFIAAAWGFYQTGGWPR
jgi:general secretion pathway protein A